MIATEELTQLRAENCRLRAQVLALQRLMIHRRSERFVSVADPEAQLNLFAERDEDIAVELLPEAPPERARTTHPGRKPLPDHFPLVVEVITPDQLDGEQTDAADGEQADPVSEDDLHREGHVLIGYETSERIEVRPAQYVRILQKRPKYRCIATGEIAVAHARDRVLARSIADETLATDIILKKFLDHLPLYRQAAILKRDYYWDVSRATMGKWVERVAVTLRPLYDALVDDILSEDYVQMDESRIAVLSSGKPGATHTGQMWLMRAPVSGAVAYRYNNTRAAKVPADILRGFSGVLQVDGYAAYTTALKTLRARGADIRQVGCSAHVRRKFFDARDSDPRASEALKLIQRMYALEAKWRDDPPDDRLAARRKQLAPVMAEMTAWLRAYEHVPTPKTPLGKAIGYALGQWPSMGIILKDGRVGLDNNGIENAVRPLALGRKNYLFAGNHGAAQNIAVLYSLLLSCKAAGVNARDYLNDTLGCILGHPVNRIAELLPGRYAARIKEVVG